MLALSYVALRFIHFAALMLLFGNALYSVWFAPSSLQRLMTRRFQRQQKLAALISLMAALLMFGLQSGLMGNGWGDVIRPAVWRSVLGTQFGGVWLWQWCWPLRRRALHGLPRKRLTAVTARDGAAGAVGGRGTCRDERWRTGSIASSQPCASPALRRDRWVVYCRCCFVCVWRKAAGSQPLSLPMRGALRRGRRAADRDNQYALYCWHKRAVACALCPAVVVQMCAGHDDGGNCAGESVFSCATLSPGGRAGTTDFIRMTQAEVVLGALVLAAVSLFATGNPSDKVK